MLGHGAIDRLIAYDWPGNVRELENVIERTLIQHRGGALSFETLLPVLHSGDRTPIQDSGRNRDLPPLDEMTAQHIRQALEMAGGSTGRESRPNPRASPKYTQEPDEQTRNSVRKKELAILEWSNMRNHSNILDVFDRQYQITS